MRIINQSNMLLLLVVLISMFFAGFEPSFGESSDLSTVVFTVQ